MHSHLPVHEMELLAAPLIVRRPEDLAADRQEVVILLHDLSFRPAEEVLSEITGGMGGGGMMGGMSMGAMDINDFNFDAYLANDRTLDDPEVVAVDALHAARSRPRDRGGSTQEAAFFTEPKPAGAGT